MGVVQTFEKTLTAAGRKLASATAMSNLSAKAARIAKARNRAKAFLSDNLLSSSRHTPFSTTLD